MCRRIHEEIQALSHDHRHDKTPRASRLGWSTMFSVRNGGALAMPNTPVSANAIRESHRPGLCRVVLAALGHGPLAQIVKVAAAGG